MPADRDEVICQLEVEIRDILSRKSRAETEILSLQSQLLSIENKNRIIDQSLEESRRIAQNIEKNAREKANCILAEAHSAVHACKQKIARAENEITRLTRLETEILAGKETGNEHHLAADYSTSAVGKPLPDKSSEPATSTVSSLNEDLSLPGSPGLTIKVVVFLNARHYMVFQNKKGSVHGHSWQFQAEVEVPMAKSSFIKFEAIESIIIRLLQPYQKTILNNVIPFNSIEPLTENLAGYFFSLFYEEYLAANCRLVKLTVWENPTKGVEVSQRLPAFVSTDKLPRAIVTEAAASMDQETEQAPNDFEKTLPAEDLSGPGRPARRSILQCLKYTRSKTEAQVWDQYDYPFWQIILAALFIIGAAVWAYYPLLTAPLDKIYPWGADTWGHLYKAEFLYRQMTQGHFLPQFDANWYNGCQPFRYWAPLPYYVIVLINGFTHNIFVAGNYYIFGCALISALAWLLFSRRLGLGVTAVIAMIWLIWPNNLQVSLDEGNLPRILATAILPFMLIAFMHAVEKGRKWIWLMVVLLVNITILCHAMMGAVYCVCLMMFAVCMWIFGCCSIGGVVRGLLAIIAGIGTSAWWLLPSLKGGLTGMDAQAAAGSVRYVSPLVSFDPILRFTDRPFLYWGISLLFVIIFTLVMWKKKPGWAKALFCCGFFTLIITFPFLAWVHRLLPLNSLLWPQRFTTFAGLALFLAAFSFNPGFFKEINLRKKHFITGIEVLLLAALLVDSYFSMILMVKGQSEPEPVISCANEIQKLPGWREATMDLSHIQSAPSYLFSSLSKREQVFGWAWQGAGTAQNIMLLNTAFEREYYPFMFKELMQLGATELVVKNDLVKHPEKLQMWAERSGYKLIRESADLSYWHKNAGPYMVKKNEGCLAIGQYASIYALQFPSVEIGSSNLLDDYKLESLKKYQVIILTGTSWHSKTRAESLMMDYVKSGGKLIVDFTGFPLDVLSRQPKFLGIYAEPISMRGGTIIKTAEKSYNTYPFSSEHENWRAYIPQGLDGGTVSFKYMGNDAYMVGYKQVADNKMWFLGANPAYHSMLTKDPGIVKILGDLIEIPGADRPAIIPFKTYRIDENGYSMSYQSDEISNAIIPIAGLDSWKASIDGKNVEITSFENLVELRLPAGFHTIKLEIDNPPVYSWGKALSLVSLVLIMIGMAINKVRSSSKQPLNSPVT